jgi:hypothetical protein
VRDPSQAGDIVDFADCFKDSSGLKGGLMATVYDTPQRWTPPIWSKGRLFQDNHPLFFAQIIESLRDLFGDEGQRPWPRRTRVTDELAQALRCDGDRVESIAIGHPAPCRLADRVTTRPLDRF